MKFLLCVTALLGIVLAAPGGRIINGEDAESGNFPYVVSIQNCGLFDCRHMCGGAIIDPRWILTSASCLTNLPIIGNLNVLAGVVDLDDNVGSQVMSVSDIIVHPDHDGIGMLTTNDIALLELSSSLTINTNVQIISYKGEEQSENDTLTGDALLAGWGATSNGIFPSFPNTLQFANLPIISDTACRNALDSVLVVPIYNLDIDNNICTGSTNASISMCIGDGGSPLTIGTQIVGVASWGVVPCGTADAPTVYTRVSSYITWIDSYVDDE